MKGGRSKTETKRTDSKLSVKRGAPSEKAGKKPAAKKGKAAKDPNKPKRPASAFFVFMEEFRKTYKEKHPNNKSVAAVGKAGGDKWKSLSEAEKAPYVAKAEKRKTEYNKTLEAYNKKMAEGPAVQFFYLLTFDYTSDSVGLQCIFLNGKKLFGWHKDDLHIFYPLIRRIWS